MAAQTEQQLLTALDGGYCDTLAEQSIDLPLLATSQNTRLSVRRGTPVRAPAQTTLSAISSGTPCTGIVPCGRADSSVAYLGPTVGQRRIAGTSVATLGSTLNDRTVQNTYQAADIVRAGVAASGYAMSTPSVLVDSNGLTYVLAFKLQDQLSGSSALSHGLYLTVFDASGVVKIPQTLVTSLGDTSSVLTQWCGLTDHGASGVRMWYSRGIIVFGVVYPIYGRTVSVSGTTLTLGTETLILTPTKDVGDIWHADVAGGHETYAWIVSNGAASADDTTITRVTLSNWATSSTTYAATNSGDPTRYAISQITVGSAHYLVAAWSSSGTGVTKVYALDGLAMTARWNTTHSKYGECAVQFGVLGPIVATSDVTGVIGTSEASTLFSYFSYAAGTLSTSNTMYWMRLHARGVTYKVSDTDITPYFPMQPNYDEIALSTDDEYLADPCVEIWSPAEISGPTSAAALVLSPVARFAVDRVKAGGVNYGLYSGATAAKVLMSTSSACCISGSQMTVTYLDFRSDMTISSIGYSPRYVTVDFASRQARYAIDEGGVALIAAAQPAHWDGVETVEYGPLRIPKVSLAATGGTTYGWAEGRTYNARAVYSYRDAAGQLHRSSPSLPKALTTTIGNIPLGQITIPPTLKQGVNQDEYDAQWFFTDNGGSVYFGQSWSPETKPTGMWRFATWVGLASDLSSVTSGQGPNVSGTPTIYSTGTNGGEILPRAPGAWWDICIVGKRAWAIDAEFRTRAVYSKIKVNGVAHEFNPALEVLFPASAGKLVAVSEIDGKPVFFSETGIYSVFGEGPNNNGAGSEFVTQKISDFPCDLRESVVRTPVGVMFLSGGRFAILQPGGGVNSLIPVSTSEVGTIVGAALVTDDDEAIFFGSSGVMVYNYSLDRFTSWTHTPQQCAAFVPLSGKVLTYTTGSNLAVIDPTTIGTTSIKLVTGWIKPGGPQGDCVIREVIIQARSTASHGLRVTIDKEYNLGNTLERTWSAAELDALTTRSQYTICVQMHVHAMRALRLMIEETETTTGGGAEILSVQINYGINPGPQRQALLTGATK